MGVRAYFDQSHDYIAIRRLSPLVNPPDDEIVCVVRAYLDGSGSNGMVGLSVYVATLGSWGRFENQWSQILRHLGMPCLHMNDLDPREKCFAGKDRVQARNAASDLLAFLRDLDEWEYRRYSCVVSAADYDRAREVVPALQQRPLHAICVDHCLGRIFTPRFREETDEERNIEILFDGTEQFFDHIRAVWRAERDTDWSWARFVLNVGELFHPDNKIAPMQAADALVWVARRYRARGDCPEWHQWLCGQKPSQANGHFFFDYDALIAKYGEA